MRVTPAALLMRRMSRFGGDRRGTVAVEFAFLAIPFFMMIFAIIEIALLFAAELVLDRGVYNVGRMIGVGISTDLNADEFRALVCDNVKIMMNCDRVAIDVTTETTFAAVRSDIPMDSRNESIDTSRLNGGLGRVAGGTIVSVRVFYKWPILTNFTRPLFANRTSDGATILTSSFAFQTEPF